MLQESSVSDITFHVVQIEKHPISKAALSETCSSLNYYRYTGGELNKEISQRSDADDFGIITDELKYGSHELYFIGHKTEITSFANGNASFNKISDTFSYYVNLTVDSETSSTQTIEMPRRVAKFELVANDALPENLSTVNFSITGAATSLNAKTGKGTTTTIQTKTIQVPNSNLNTKGCSFSAYVFLIDNTGQISVTVTAKDESDNILASHTFHNVEMETNYITRYKGNMFSGGFGMNISASSEWSGTKDNTF